MLMEDRLVRDLPEKSYVESDDRMMIEDVDGTKLARISLIRKAIMDKLLFNNIEEMKMSSIECDSFCITLGYREPGDGGGAIYKIVYEPTVVEDGANWIYLYTSDTNRAKFVSIDGTVTPEQFGAYGDGIKNDSQAINKCLESGYDTILNGRKTYLITSPLLIPDIDNAYIDMNGCIIKTSNCNAFEANISYKNGLYKTINIKNGTIDMKGSKDRVAIKIDRYAESLTMKDITVWGGSSGKDCVIGGPSRITIDNCNFTHVASDSGTSIEISCGNTESWIPEIQDVNICNTKFNRCSIGVKITNNLFDKDSNMNLNINNCSINVGRDFANGCYLVLNKGINDLKNKRIININDAYVNGVASLIYNERSDTINIKNAILKNSQHLFNCINNDANITLNGEIVLSSLVKLSTPFPVFPKGRGNIYINTSLLKWDNIAYVEVETTLADSMHNDEHGNVLKYRGLYGYEYTVYDNVNINACEPYKPIYNSSNPPEVLGINTLRNTIIVLSPNVDLLEISPGVNNQIIGLIAGTEYTKFTVTPSTTIDSYTNTAESEVDNPAYIVTGRKYAHYDEINIVNRVSIVYFKYNSSTGKWHQLWRD